MQTLKGLTVPPGTEWEELFTLFLTLDNHNIMPDKEWYNEALEKITAIGAKKYIYHVVLWASDKMGDYEAYKDRMDEYWNNRFTGKNTRALEGTLENVQRFYPVYRYVDRAETHEQSRAGPHPDAGMAFLPADPIL